MSDIVPFGDALRVWVRVALMSFGGPAGQISVMHRELVEERCWVEEPQFLHALNFCMLLPGPEAQQLATYIGWLLNGTKGGIVAGGLFVLPGAVAILALSFLYALFGRLAPIEALFFGLKAAVLAIVADAVIRIGRRALKSRLSQLVAALAFVAIFFFAVPFPLIVLAAALIGFLVPIKSSSHGDAKGTLPERERSWWLPATFAFLWLAPLAALVAFAGPTDLFTTVGFFFSRMAVVTFGGAYAVLAYVAQQAVDHYHWLTASEMLDGLGMAETTPGPLIMVTQFVGFLAGFRNAGGLNPLLAGTLAALLTTWVTFIPCFLWIFLGAPYIERLRHKAALSSALAAVTAAVVGVILNLAIWFAVHTLFSRIEPVRWRPLHFDAPAFRSVNPMAALLAIAAAVAILRFRVNSMLVLGACAAAGILLKLLGVG